MCVLELVCVLVSVCVCMSVYVCHCLYMVLCGLGSLLPTLHEFWGQTWVNLLRNLLRLIQLFQEYVTISGLCGKHLYQRRLSYLATPTHTPQDLVASTSFMLSLVDLFLNPRKSMSTFHIGLLIIHPPGLKSKACVTNPSPYES